MFNKELITQFRTTVHQATHIWICMHTDPDGDCIGSAYGLWIYLQHIWKHIRYFAPTRIPKLFSFLPETEQIDQHIPSSYTPDLRISVDTATKQRSNLRQIATNTPIIHIDHHHADHPRGTINLINSSVSSTCELITFLLQQNDPEQITSRIATFLLMGISTDTGHFQRGKDLDTVFGLSSFLMKQWADLTLLVNKLYRSNNFLWTQFIWSCLQRLQRDSWVIRVHVAESERKTYGLDEAHIELLLFIMTSIDHDGIFLLFKEYPDAATPYMKCSLRTKHPDIDLNQFAQQFWWGGHRAASGIRFSDGDFSVQQHQLITAANEYIHTSRQ